MPPVDNCHHQQQRQQSRAVRGLAHGEQTRCCVQDAAAQAECHAAPSSDYQRMQDLEHTTGDHGGANDSRTGYRDCDRIDPGDNTECEQRDAQGDEPTPPPGDVGRGGMTAAHAAPCGRKAALRSTMPAASIMIGWFRRDDEPGDDATACAIRAGEDADKSEPPVRINGPLVLDSDTWSVSCDQEPWRSHSPNRPMLAAS